MHTQPQYGAHEVIELHEVLNQAGDALNTVQLYLPYATDPELTQLVRHQFQFMQQEYNGMVHAVRGLGAGEIAPYRSAWNLAAGSQQPAGQGMSASPQANAYAAPLQDRDVASALLGLHKAGAKLRLSAALEASHPQIRDMLLQAAVNCSHQAYEVWGYMQRKGYYPKAVMPEAERAQLLGTYQPVASASQGLGTAPAMSGDASGQAYAGAQPAFSNGNLASLQTGGHSLQPVSATSRYAPPSPQGTPVEDTSLIADGLQTDMTDTTGILTQQAEGKQPRGRKG
jgi:spore coat protein CotF